MRHEVAKPDISIKRPSAITVVVPCLNEAENVRPAYQEIVAELGPYELQVLFVDDGSTDATLELIRALAHEDPRVSYLSLSRNFGLEAAFSAGYRYASHPWVLHLDADLQFPPAEAHRLVDRAGQGFDAVFGRRVDRRDRWIRRAASSLHDVLARRLLAIEIPPDATTFRLVRTDLARRIVDLRLGTPYFLATVPRLTSAWTTVEVAHRPRTRGTAKVSVRGLARHAVELYISFTERPIRFASMLCLLAGTVTAVATVGGRGGGPVVQGLALASGLFALAVIARYLVHIGRGQPDVPQFLIREANLPVRAEDLLSPGRSAADLAIPESTR
ncbi:glycosyltransferase family 2 protein [Plantactinospora sp. GCM10030261]|uniref:glycosyltransferase family 2 protein n=1 Tax=Plantactinospora sp. GCM10030261 TaxID=3273420 RepID=UPI00361852B1